MYTKSLSDKNGQEITDVCSGWLSDEDEIEEKGKNSHQADISEDTSRVYLFQAIGCIFEIEGG